MIKRVSSLKILSQSNKKSVSDKPLGEILINLYKKCAIKINMKVHPTIIASLRYKHGLDLDLDILDGR